jgi:hypothetical protein
MTSPDEMSVQHEAARQQSRATWNAVAPGWFAQRVELGDVFYDPLKAVHHTSY